MNTTTKYIIIAVIIVLILFLVWSQRSTYPIYYNAAAPVVPLNKCQQLAPSLRRQCEEASRNPVSWLGRV